MLEKEGAVVTIGSQYDPNDDFDCILIDNNAAERNADQLTSAGIPLVAYTGDVVIARRLFPNAVIIVHCWHAVFGAVSQRSSNCERGVRGPSAATMAPFFWRFSFVERLPSL